MRIFLALLPLMVGLAIAPAGASVSILVDEVHGLPATDLLTTLLPQCEFTQLTAADFPITDMLASGMITVPDEVIVFDVPPGAETLYGRFVFEGAQMQLPFIFLHGPDGAAIIGHCNGSFHVEDPVPGEYTVVYESWQPMTTLYEIGTGPDFLTADTVADYDLVFSLWDDTFFLFIGAIRAYSPREESVLSAYVGNGGGYLYVREPLVAIAMKPIVNLYATASMQCAVALSFPGALTFAEPPCTTTPATNGTLFRWQDIAVAAGMPAQILYEGKLAKQAAWLQVNVAADRIQISNSTPYPLADLSLLRRHGPDDWQLLRLDTVPAGSVINTAVSERLDRRTLIAHLEAQLREGGHQAGLYATEIDEFIAHYRWADRWLAEAESGPGWCAVYRLSGAAYDDFIPMLEQQQPQQTVRTMWVWTTGLGDGPAVPIQPAQPVPPAQSSATTSRTTPDAVAGTRNPQLVYHEYGVLWQRGASTDGSRDRTPGFLNWDFYDEASLWDPVDNYLDPQCIIFSQPGGHPDAAAILSGVPEVRGMVSGAVFAPWPEQLLTGGEFCHTADDVFPPGSYPPVAVARSLGAGRLAAVADRDMLATEPYNPQFFANLVTWLAQDLTAAPNLPAPHAQIVSVVPNPFNPRTTITFSANRRGALHIAVYDLTGKRLAELAAGTYDEGTYTVTWNGCDAAAEPLPSGVYLVRLVSDDQAQSRKLMLIR